MVAEASPSRQLRVHPGQDSSHPPHTHSDGDTGDALFPSPAQLWGVGGNWSPGKNPLGRGWGLDANPTQTVVPAAMEFFISRQY